MMVSHHDPASSSSASKGKVVHRAVNACLCPLYAVEGMHVVTVEGLGTKRGGLHPVQKALAHAHGSQCGFCTPGFVMSMYALLRSKVRTSPMTVTHSGVTQPGESVQNFTIPTSAPV